MPSNTITRTYFIKENNELPAISISVDPEYLKVKSDFNQNCEHPATIEFYDQDYKLAFNIGCGIKVTERSHVTPLQNSFVIFARDKYGATKFNDPIFKGANSFKLTNTSEDLIQPNDQMDTNREAHNTCILFINGNYWGVYNLKENNDHMNERK